MTYSRILRNVKRSFQWASGMGAGGQNLQKLVTLGHFLRLSIFPCLIISDSNFGHFRGVKLVQLFFVNTKISGPTSASIPVHSNNNVAFVDPCYNSYGVLFPHHLPAHFRFSLYLVLILTIDY